MPLLGFLNELSQPANGTANDEVRRQLSDLAQTVRSIRELRRDFSFQTETPIPKWRFNQDYGFKEFRQEGQFREAASFLLSSANRSPMKRGLDEARETDDALEFQYNGIVSEAFGLANLFDGIVLSFNVPPWQSTLFQVDRIGLEEEEDGNINIVTTAVEVRNICKEGDLNAHRPWLESVGKEPYRDFEEFEKNRSDRLSKIKFLESALGQFKAISAAHPWWSAVSQRFDELQQAVAAWHPATSAEPKWLSYTTREDQQRKNSAISLI